MLKNNHIRESKKYEGEEREEMKDCREGGAAQGFLLPSSPFGDRRRAKSKPTPSRFPIFAKSTLEVYFFYPRIRSAIVLFFYQMTCETMFLVIDWG